jgi:hypothetical protein
MHQRELPQNNQNLSNNLFHELSNLGWINDSAGDPPIWSPNHQLQINKWIKDPNINVNQHTDPNVNPTTQMEPTMKAVPSLNCNLNNTFQC